MEVTGRKVSWEIVTVQAGGGNGNRAVVVGGGSGGRDNIPEAQSQMDIDIEVAQLQYIIPSQEHEDALYLQSFTATFVLVWFMRIHSIRDTKTR